VTLLKRGKELATIEDRLMRWNREALDTDWGIQSELFVSRFFLISGRKYLSFLFQVEQQVGRH
jgi:hypothetical protein